MVVVNMLSLLSVEEEADSKAGGGGGGGGGEAGRAGSREFEDESGWVRGTTRSSVG